VLDREAFPVDPEQDEVRDVYQRCLVAAQALLQRVIPRLHEVTPVEQDNSASTYYSAADDSLLGDRRYWTRADTSLE
jgi:methionyl-tRNA formyltransferase